VPEAVGVPEMVMLPPEKVPVTPAGKPENVAPVAPVVLYVIGVIAVFTQTVWLFVPGAEVYEVIFFFSFSQFADGYSLLKVQGEREADYSYKKDKCYP